MDKATYQSQEERFGAGELETGIKILLKLADSKMLCEMKKVGLN
jgi:hypothetical protein